MSEILNKLREDIHFIEGMNSCMNCGVCTAICPAAEFYNYDPRVIVETVQRGKEKLSGIAGNVCHAKHVVLVVILPD